VLDAYRAQFHADFLAFLSCRAAETRARGLLLLTFVARRDARPTAHDCYLWDLLADALMDMAAAGLVDEEKVHSFNAPYYAPCPDDLARVIAKEGSFALRTMQLFDTTRRRLLGPSHPTSDGDDDDEFPRWLAAETAGTYRQGSRRAYAADPLRLGRHGRALLQVPPPARGILPQEVYQEQG
jgi:jasmonate O-methyltransferase